MNKKKDHGKFEQCKLIIRNHFFIIKQKIQWSRNIHSSKAFSGNLHQGLSGFTGDPHLKEFVQGGSWGQSTLMSIFTADVS